MKELRINRETQEQYSNVRAFIDGVVDTKELGYVYTFPDKRLYAPVQDSASFIKEAWEGYEGEIGMYAHIPYCTPKPPPPEIRESMKEHGVAQDGRDHLCGYCNLFTVPANDVPRGFTDSVIHEIRLYEPIFQKKDIRPTSLYFGGGSPSLLPAKDLQRIVNSLESVFGKVPNNKERSIECIPDSVDYKKLKALRDIGFNRVSIGAQTFDEDVLHYSGRNYDPKLGYEAIRNALEIGFANVNADLIIGLPSSSKHTFLKDIELMRQLRPHTITLYQDMTRPITRFGKMAEHGILPEVSQQEIYEQSMIADQQLSADGYRRQTLTCWTRDSWGYQQGEDIYNGIPMIGFGPGARSYGPNAHYSTEYAVSARLANYLIHRWREKIDQGQFPDIHGYALDPDTKKRARIILRLMSSQGIASQEFEDLFNQELEALRDSGMVHEDNGKLKYTETGKAYSGALSRIFFGEEIENKLKAYEHK